MNHIHLIGRLGDDPRVSPYAENKQPKTPDTPKRNVVSFDIAVARDHINRGDGGADWIPITVFGGPASRFAEKHLKKGDLIAVTGRLEAKAWSPEDGPSRKVFRVIASEILGLDGARANAKTAQTSAHAEDIKEAV